MQMDGVAQGQRVQPNASAIAVDNAAGIVLA